MFPRLLLSSLSKPLALAVLATVLTSGALLGASLTEEFNQTYPLAAGGRVSLENINGDLKVEAWDRAEVAVEAIKSASSEEALGKLEIVVVATADSVRIKTHYPENVRGDHSSVDYTLHVPRTSELGDIELVNGSLRMTGLGGRVEVSLVNGSAKVENLAGDVELETVNGRLEVSFDALGGKQSVKLSSVNGSIDLEVPAAADAQLSAETVHGSIKNDFGLEVERDSLVGRSLEGKLGSGAARVELETVNGSIEIHRG